MLPGKLVSVVIMPSVTRHMIERGDGAAVELFQTLVPDAVPAGALLLVHGYQRGLQLGAKEFVENGALHRLSSALNITAAAVSQPGFGTSDGPADFCGPHTQRAIMAALDFLKAQPSVDPESMVLFGHSRGAIASAMVAAEVSWLRAVVLSAGIYDLKPVFDTASPGIRRNIENEAGLTHEAFLARSALHHVDRIASEILLLHGKYDDRAPVTQAETFADALAGAEVQVALSLFDCGHRIPREDSNEVLRPFLKRVFDPAVGSPRLA